jgi:hypothetical protein
MEVLVRIAIQKYLKSKPYNFVITLILGKQVNTNREAVLTMFKQSVMPFISKFDCHDWRLKRLWNEECDIVFRYYMLALKTLYDKFSGKYAKPGMPKFMSLEEINGMLVSGDLLDDQFGQREVGI